MKYKIKSYSDPLRDYTLSSNTDVFGEIVGLNQYAQNEITGDEDAFYWDMFYKRYFIAL